MVIVPRVVSWEGCPGVVSRLTCLAYGTGDLVHNFVGITDDIGIDFAMDDVERFLIRYVCVRGRILYRNAVVSMTDVLWSE